MLTHPMFQQFTFGQWKLLVEELFYATAVANRSFSYRCSQCSRDSWKNRGIFAKVIFYRRPPEKFHSWNFVDAHALSQKKTKVIIVLRFQPFKPNLMLVENVFRLKRPKTVFASTQRLLGYHFSKQENNISKKMRLCYKSIV